MTKMAITPEKKLPDDQAKKVSGFSIARTEASTGQKSVIAKPSASLDLAAKSI